MKRRCSARAAASSIGPKPARTTPAAPWLTYGRIASYGSWSSPFSRRNAFSARCMSGAVSSRVPSRSNSTARSRGGSGGGTAEMSQVIDRRARRKRERARQRVVRDAGEVVQFQSGGAAPTREFRRADEFQVIVGAGGKRPGHIFGADD